MDVVSKLNVVTDEINPFRKWYIKYFINRYVPKNICPKLAEYFTNSKNDINYLYGSYNRLLTFTIFGYLIEFDTVNTVCTTFKIKDLDNDNEAIFAFGYYFTNSNKFNEIFRLNLLKSDQSWAYFVLGGSCVSKDGEYRSVCISAVNYNMIMLNNQYNIVVSDIIDYFKLKLSDRKFIILKEYFFPTDDKKVDEPIVEYYTYTLQYSVFALTWFNLMYAENNNIVANNINDIFKKIMLKHVDEDLEFFNSLINKYSKTKIDEIYNLTNNIRLDKKYSDTKIGQKIIPLSISEVQNPFDIQYKPWREYLISSYLSKFVINYVSPGFFVTNLWFYIKNAKKGLFDNDIQYEKMERSELAEQIITLLSRANIYTNENIVTKNKHLNKKDKLIKSWISEKFEKLSEKIQDPIEYAKKEIIMSNVALCFMTEYVGRTIMDVITICKKSEYYNELIGLPFTLKGFPIFNKYMFDICYNLYCMNRIAGIIHGDLHLNNATLKPMTYKNNRDINNIKNPTVLYIIGDNADDYYILPTVTYNICIIDYSRSIVLLNDINRFRDMSLPASYSIINNLNTFHLEQVDRLINIYVNYTSNSNIDKDNLRIIFRNNFEGVFKLLTSTDIYGFTQKLICIFSMNDKNIIKPHKLCIDLLKKINTYAEYYIIEEMNKIILNPSYADQLIDMEYPMYTIIKKCFYENTVNNIEVGNIVDVFNINNKLEFSLESLSKYPDILKHPKIIENNKIVDKLETMTKVKIFNKMRIKYENIRKNNMKMVNFIASRHRSKHM